MAPNISQTAIPRKSLKKCYFKMSDSFIASMEEGEIVGEDIIEFPLSKSPTKIKKVQSTPTSPDIENNEGLLQIDFHREPCDPLHTPLTSTKRRKPLDHVSPFKSNAMQSTPDYGKHMQKCICPPSEVEVAENGRHKTPLPLPERPLRYSDCLLSSEFQVSKNLMVSVNLLSTLKEVGSNRVKIGFHTGGCQVFFYSRSFLKSVFDRVTMGLLTASAEYTGEMDTLCFRENNTLEFVRDNVCAWVIMRTYVDGKENAYIKMCSSSWVEVKRIQPLIAMCVDHYTNLLLEDRCDFPNNCNNEFNRV